MEGGSYIDLSINEPWGEKWNCVSPLSSSLASLASWSAAAAGLMNLEMRCEAVCVCHTDKPQLVFFRGTRRRPHLWSFSDLFSTDNRHRFKVELSFAEWLWSSTPLIFCNTTGFWPMTSLWAATTSKRTLGHPNQIHFLNPECIRISWVLAPKIFPIENFYFHCVHQNRRFWGVLLHKKLISWWNGQLYPLWHTPQ